MMTAESIVNPLRLQTLLQGFCELNAAQDVAVQGLCVDSRQIEPGDVFLALQGIQHDGLQFVRTALTAGAIAVVHESPADEVLQSLAALYDVPLIYLPDLSQQLGVIASRFYLCPSNALQVVGVTGTDGKTSVSHFVAQCLNHLYVKHNACGLIGTIGNGFLQQLDTATHTTPDALQLQSLLAQLQTAGARAVAMEASSHGLSQYRADGVEFNIAVLTNLGRDHLDYHQDLTAYKAAKQRLFAMPGLQAAVLNAEDAFGHELAQRYKGNYQICQYALALQSIDPLSADDWVVAEQLAFHTQGMRLQVRTPNEAFAVAPALLGDFNASNVLAVIAVLRCLKFKTAEIVAAVNALQSVDGRMQMTTANQQPAVVIDYAHTPQALAAALQALRRHCEGKLWCVFGCGGDRDAGKRPLMGQLAVQYADYVVLTDDNPRGESPVKIVEDILSGVGSQANVTVKHDRYHAIVDTVSNAAATDIVLVAGKGHEDYQIIGNQRFAFSDQSVVNHALGVLSE